MLTEDAWSFYSTGQHEPLTVNITFLKLITEWYTFIYWLTFELFDLVYLLRNELKSSSPWEKLCSIFAFDITSSSVSDLVKIISFYLSATLRGELQPYQISSTKCVTNTFFVDSHFRNNFLQWTVFASHTTRRNWDSSTDFRMLFLVAN